MQANVNLITTAGTSTALFRKVLDDAPHEFGAGDFPNLVVWSRSLVGFEPITTDLKRYNARWRYNVYISELRSKGHAVVENLLLKFLVALWASASDPWFEIVGDIEIAEGYVGQHQIIGAAIVIDMLTAYDLEIV